MPHWSWLFKETSVKKNINIFHVFIRWENVETLLRSSIPLALTFLTIFFVFSSHLKSSVTIVPSNFVLFNVSIFWSLSLSLVANWYFLVKLKIMLFVLFSLINIFCFFVQSLISFSQFWDFNFSGGINWLWTGISVGICCLILYDVWCNTNCEQVDNLQHSQIIHKLESVLVTD